MDVKDRVPIVVYLLAKPFAKALVKDM